MALHAQSNPICASQACGNVNISYPFWKIDTQSANQYCGYEGFGISCSDDGRQRNITLGDDSYYVRDINYTSGTILLADYDVSEVARVPICPRVRHNITIGTLPLNFSTSSVNISFHFDCTNGCPRFAQEIPCLGNNDRKSCVHVMNNNIDQYWYWPEFPCSQVVVTAGSEDYINEFPNLPNSFRYVLEEGFALQWKKMDGCDKCEESDVHCGQNNRLGTFICFCPDGTTNRVNCNKGN